MDYPARPPFFLARVIRMLTKSAAGMEIGPEGIALVMIVVGQEDSCRYTRPVNFWNTQLAPLVGIRGGDPEGLRRVRDRCVKAGWLQYLPGNKQQPASYYATIPAAVNALADGGSDESPQEYAGYSTSIPRQRRQESAENKPPSSPNPLPMPMPKDNTSAAPRGGDGLFDRFWDAYAKKVGKPDALKAWRKLSDEDKQAALAGAAAYVQAHPEAKYRKDPVRYLTKRGWQDEQPVDAGVITDWKGNPNPFPAGTTQHLDWLMMWAPADYFR